MKSGQCDLRGEPLELVTTTLQVLVPAALAAVPAMNVRDVVEDVTVVVPPTATSDWGATARLRIATFTPEIFPGASYEVWAAGAESPPIVRPYPADPADATRPSLFALGDGSWLGELPSLARVHLTIAPLTPSAFDGGVAATVAIGNSVPYDTVTATRAADGSWTADLLVAEATTTCVRLLPANGNEPTPYAWIDTGRYFEPAPGVTEFFTTEGIYGVTGRGRTVFSEPPSRAGLMADVFGAAVVAAAVFDAREMPHGATIHPDGTYFVVHAPHAASADVVIAADDGTGRRVRREIPMTLTPDTRYWWCAVPSSDAPPGTPYRLRLNDALEVLDPAAREVQDRGTFDVAPDADPNDPTTAWSLVADVAATRAVARAHPWQTMGWSDLLIYELHAARFSDASPAGAAPRAPLDLLADELQPVSRLGQPGYLGALPVTAFELLPVQEFSSAISWGYDPSFYFAVDGHYGGSAALARFVDAAHAAGRAVLLDVVYNHSLGSPLMKIAPDVYRNGDYDGDRMNCGHPAVREHLRQATIHLWRTFGIDGFRFDDTQTIVQRCEGGWEFLRAIVSAVRRAAAAEASPWPFCVAENSATQPWDVSDPGFGVTDGQWAIDESYRLRDASYDLWNDAANDADSVRTAVADPVSGPFYRAVRFGESHDMVSAQDAQNQRIAARPPFGAGMRMAKALGALTLLSRGVPMLFMGQEYGETRPFSFDASAPALNPQAYDRPSAPIVNGRVLAWFRQLMGLRNDPSQGLQGEANDPSVAVGHRTVAFTCGRGQSLFVVVTFGTANETQDSSWLGLPGGPAYKEIFNSSWPAFAVEFEPERANGGYAARIVRGQPLNLPAIGAVVFQRA